MIGQNETPNRHKHKPFHVTIVQNNLILDLSTTVFSLNISNISLRFDPRRFRKGERDPYYTVLYHSYVSYTELNCVNLLQRCDS